jgi:hypothetical protein
MVIETQSEKQALKKRKIDPPFQIINFFGNQQPYNKSNPLQQTFLEDLILYVTKVHQFLSSIENMSL